MRVLVFEQWFGGHYFNYIESLLPRLSQLASEVVVTLTQRAMDTEDFRKKFDPLRNLSNVRFEGIVTDANPTLPASERFRLLMNLRDAIAATKPDHVLLPTADAQNLAHGALGHLGVRVLPRELPIEATFHDGYGPAIGNWKHAMKEAVYRLAFSGSSWTRLNFVNFLYCEHVLRHRARWADRIRLLPDPVPVSSRLTRAQARKLLNVPEDGRYVGILGALDARKAIPELIAAFRRARLGASDRLLLAGRLDARYLAMIESDHADLVKSGRLLLINRFLSDEELNQGYAALDLACAPYRDFPGLASLLLKGVAAGRPVIAHNFGWSRALINRFGVGSVTDVFNPDTFAAAMLNALEASADYRESEATKRLLAFHHPSNFTETMLDGVRRRTGQPELQPLRTWDWVLEALDPAKRELI